MPSLKRFDGEFTADNRASGLPVPGYRQTVVSAPTLWCKHCGGVSMVNPYRTRPREYCRICDHYICDGCHATAQIPDYKHRTIDDLTDMVTSGNFTIVGGTVCNPILVPTGART